MRNACCMFDLVDRFRKYVNKLEVVDLDEEVSEMVYVMNDCSND